MASHDLLMQHYREMWGEREAIMWLFHDRCAMCGKPADEVNEIIPRARTKHATENWRNQVALCHSCHMDYHQGGVTNEKQIAMKQAREDFLIMTGREEYV